MALRKVLGVETEFGIIVRGAGESNPIAASSVLINAYVHELARAGHGRREQPKVGWDFEDEHPDVDARGYSNEGTLAPEVETHLVNAVLTNGARYYVDHAHPECSTPECADPRSIVVFDKAAELILQRSMAAAVELLPAGQEIVVYKNNSDRKGNSYGCHENYLMDRQVPFSRIVTHVMPHFVTRQVYTGAGKVGTEAAGLTHEDVPFQLSQRSDFFEEEVGLETTLKRPIVNTRDEPHADAQRYRRLHVIVGDANLAEVATFLKVGTTALVLSMIEDDFLPRDLSLATPVSALRKVSYDLSLRLPLELADGSTMTALEIQWEYLDRAKKYAEEYGLECIGAPEVGDDLLRRWEGVLTALETDPMSLAGQVDWVAKKRLIDGYRTRRPPVGRRPPRRDGPAVPRPAARQEPGQPGRPRTAHHRRRGRPGGIRAAGRHAGLLPRQVPAAVGIPDRGGQLGFHGVRHRRRPVAAGPHDGPDTWNGGARR